MSETAGWDMYHRRPVESLEDRRLLSVNLYFGPGSFGGPIDQPGRTVNYTIPVSNAGTQNVTQSFYVEFKLVKSELFAPQNTNFYDPNAVRLAMVRVDSDVPINGGVVSVPVQVTYPSDRSPGHYNVLVAIDSTLAVAETNESDNYAAFGGTRFLPDGTDLVFEGTDNPDTFDLRETQVNGSTLEYTLAINGFAETFTPAEASGFDLRGSGGNDSIRALGNIPNLRMDGGDGNDTLTGGNLGDFLVGGAGKDLLDGAGGNDRLNGNGGHDRLYGTAGNDRLYGYAGNDYLDGGAAADRLDGGAGADTLAGQGGNDRYYAGDGEPDQIFGGSGSDTLLSHDSTDSVASVDLITG